MGRIVVRGAMDEGAEGTGMFADEVEAVAAPADGEQPCGGAGDGERLIVGGEAEGRDDAETDPTGRFMRQLLVEEVGLAPRELDDVLFTNAVRCLPREHYGKHPVSARQCYPRSGLADDSAHVDAVRGQGER